MNFHFFFFIRILEETRGLGGVQQNVFQQCQGRENNRIQAEGICTMAVPFNGGVLENCFRPTTNLPAHPLTASLRWILPGFIMVEALADVPSSGSPRWTVKCSQCSCITLVRAGSRRCFAASQFSFAVFIYLVMRMCSIQFMLMF